jgi:nucleoside-diphosphate kinase
MRNLVHASGSADEAKREISLWFSPEEIYSYPKDLDRHHS